MPNKVAYSFKLLDKFSGPAGRVKASADKIKRSLRANEKQARATRKRFRELGSTLNNVARKSLVFSAGLLAVAGLAVRQSAKFESLRVSFETLAGSVEVGRRAFEGLKKFSATTPFQLEEVAGAGKILLAFGFQADELTGTLRRLGDLAAGTGKPLSEFALIFGKIKAKGKVTGEELQQLAEKGINLREALGRKFGLSAEQIEKAVSKGLIKFEAVRDVLVEMTSEGGKFFELTQKQSKTASGLWSTFKDNVALAGAEIGDVLFEVLDLKAILAGATARLGSFVDKFKVFVKEHPNLTKLGVALGIFLSVLGPLAAMASAAFVSFGFMSTAAAGLGVSVGAILTPLLLVPAAIAGILAAGTLLVLQWNNIKLLFTFTVDAIKDGIDKLKGLTSGFFSDKLGSIMKFFGKVDVDKSSQTDINVNLAGPKGTVQNVKSKTTGDSSGLNVRVAMAEGL